MDFINRELSWLEFNQRVLEQALSPQLPLLERAKFLAITASNLDEFFMVRMGGLSAMSRSAIRTKDMAGLTPHQQLNLVGKRASTFIEDQYRLFNEDILPALAKEGLAPLSLKNLSSKQKELLNLYYLEHIFPLLTPLAVEDTLPPYLPAQRLIIALELKEENTQNKRVALIPLPDALPRRIPVPDDNEESYVLCEDLIASSAQSLFPAEKITASGVFRFTRNGDVIVQEEEGLDLAEEMEEVLIERRFSHCVRLDISTNTPLSLSKKIKELIQAESAKTYRLQGSLDITWLMELSLSSERDDLKAEDWKAQPSPQIDPSLSLMENIQKGDILLNHPYESFEPVVRFIEEAAKDPQVIAIKQVLYRTAKDSKIIAALIEAAKNGKHVTALVELKARFDEARNIDRAEDLQRAGVQVVYGVKGLKTHAKICLVVRREEGHIKRYCHFGTGNYNESTARLYTDISLLTCQNELGADASLFFNSVTGCSKILHFHHLVPSPLLMKRRLLQLIESEALRAKQGEEGHIMAKMNSLQDKDIIEALYKAAEAGVRIELNVRGICCLQTSSEGPRAKIRVVSIVDKYLEHARIFYFHQGSEPQVFIASADWMERNLEKRVELMIPILEKAHARRLTQILKNAFKDNTQAWEIGPDGTGKRLCPPSAKKAFRLQEYLSKEARRQAKEKERERLLTFEPQNPLK